MFVCSVHALQGAYTGGRQGGAVPLPRTQSYTHFSNLKLKSEEHKKIVCCSKLGSPPPPTQKNKYYSAVTLFSLLSSQSTQS